ncbi:DUF4299 family protein [Oceanivirga salmonicida]|uniref:DUF4299 family protein n=1 Tax=Oceanivirga salmonicida TaxID=1769291 RepID=UPI0012E21258|nr:DUF4299 family protein [Oceanivirga salmonicida]
MSVIFKIEPKKEKKMFGLLSKKTSIVNEIKKMSVKNFLEMFDNKYESIIDDEEFLNGIIGENNYISLGCFAYTSRAFDFCCHKDYFEIYINTPSTTKDWKLLLEFLEDMLIKTNGILINENEEKIKISDIDYKKDIMAGIEAVYNHFNEKESDKMMLIGPDRSIEISKEMITKVMQSNDIIAEFDKMLEKVFYSTAYFAKQKFYKKDDKIIGVYTIGDGYDVVIPLKPSVNYQNLGIEKEHGKISRWVLTVVFFENKEKGEKQEIFELDYLENISKLKGYKELDANQIELSAKTKDELREMLEV